MKELTLSPETQTRFAEISQSKQFLDEMERQAEIATQNQILFQQTAQNFSPVNQYDEAEAKEMKIWKDDREQREAQIARDNAQKRSVMTDEEKAEQDAIAIDEAAKMEANEEQEREGSAQIL